ncbi:C-type lectin-like protein [Pigeonpox virus]|uniref:C-type lectin family protein n=1 Tax=Pigeonpox virus TaxID=10264 RepID=A0A068EEB3_9POXV|nr:C-type lectin family protein [Pigeonpox virus]YP_009046468.1 C-type lectin-like protein [Pigeonpox virus]AID46521.1 C-type lectin family protein [Pigeonpox virus]AID46744.1 C-type lectin-like protein [Pigeonpox virus]WCL39963.1 C-type lectin family protein [Pigeonpox virus]
MTYAVEYYKEKMKFLRDNSERYILPITCLCLTSVVITSCLFVALFITVHNCKWDSFSEDDTTAAITMSSSVTTDSDNLVIHCPGECISHNGICFLVTGEKVGFRQGILRCEKLGYDMIGKSEKEMGALKNIWTGDDKVSFWVDNRTDASTFDPVNDCAYGNRSKITEVPKVLSSVCAVRRYLVCKKTDNSYPTTQSTFYN